MQAQKGLSLVCDMCGYDHYYKKCLVKGTVIEQMIDKIIDYAPFILDDYIKLAHVELHYNIDRIDVSLKVNNVTPRDIKDILNKY